MEKPNSTTTSIFNGAVDSNIQCLPFLRKRSPDGATLNCDIQLQLATYLSTQKGRKLSWPGWLTYSGRFTHISGHPSDTGRAQDRECSPTKDRRSTAVPRNHLRSCVRCTLIIRIIIKKNNNNNCSISRLQSGFYACIVVRNKAVVDSRLRFASSGLDRSDQFQQSVAIFSCKTGRVAVSVCGDTLQYSLKESVSHQRTGRMTQLFAYLLTHKLFSSCIRRYLVSRACD